MQLSLEHIVWETALGLVHKQEIKIGSATFAVTLCILGYYVWSVTHTLMCTHVHVCKTMSLAIKQSKSHKNIIKRTVVKCTAQYFPGCEKWLCSASELIVYN